MQRQALMQLTASGPGKPNLPLRDGNEEPLDVLQREAQEFELSRTRFLRAASDMPWVESLWCGQCFWQPACEDGGVVALATKSSSGL